MTRPVDPRALPTSRQSQWYAVVPVRGGVLAKTRLRPRTAEATPQVALAMALDTVAALVEALGAGHVIVVSSDQPVSEGVIALGAISLHDTAGRLNEAILLGVEAARERDPECSLAVVLADHPALTAEAMREALEVAGRYPRAVLADADGSGTALLTATRGHRLTPAFGPGSAQRHTDLGYLPLDLDSPALRVDVDDAASLITALGLGVGPRTAEVLSRYAPRHAGDDLSTR